MEIIDYSFLLLSVASIYFTIRIKYVHAFLNKASDMAYEYEVRHVQDPHDDAFLWFAHKHSYERVLFSLKPLKLEYWYTKEELEKIES